MDLFSEGQKRPLTLQFSLQKNKRKSVLKLNLIAFSLQQKKTCTSKCENALGRKRFVSGSKATKGALSSGAGSVEQSVLPFWR